MKTQVNKCACPRNTQLHLQLNKQSKKSSCVPVGCAFFLSCFPPNLLPSENLKKNMARNGCAGRRLEPSQLNQYTTHAPSGVCPDKQYTVRSFVLICSLSNPPHLFPLLSKTIGPLPSSIIILSGALDDDARPSATQHQAMKALIDDVGLLVSGGMLLVLCVRWLVGLWTSRKRQQQQQHQHRPGPIQVQAATTTTLPHSATQQTEEKTRDQDCGGASNSLIEPLLQPTHIPFSQQPHFYLMRNRTLAWSREVCGLLLFAVYLARASTRLYGGKDTTGGVRLLLVAGGWLLLSSLEEMPALGGQGRMSTCGGSGTNRRRGDTSTKSAAFLRSPAWLTLWLGYIFYAALAVHPFLVAADKPGGLDVAKEVAGVQLYLAALALLLLGAEAVIALKETRHDALQSGHFRSRNSQEEFLYSPLSPPSAPAGTGADQRAESGSYDGGENGDSKSSHNKETKTASGFRLFTKLTVPPSPEQKASLLSTLLFSWIGPVLATGKQKVLALEDLNELEQEDRSVYIWRAFRPHLRAVETRHRQQQQQQQQQHHHPRPLRLRPPIRLVPRQPLPPPRPPRITPPHFLCRRRDRLHARCGSVCAEGGAGRGLQTQGVRCGGLPVGGYNVQYSG